MTDSNNNRIPVNRKILQQIFSKIKISTELFYNNSPCWEWTAYRDKDGYGKLRDGKNQRPAHRLIFSYFVEQIPSHLHCDHLCQVKHCVNPCHMEPVTPKINIYRSANAASLNVQKTHCLRGHPFNETNTRLSPDKRHRICRKCEYEKTKRLRQHKRQKLS